MEGTTMRLRHLALNLCALLLPVASFAVPVKYEFSGQINLGGGYTDPGPDDIPAFNALFPGAPLFSGSITIETTTVPDLTAPGFLDYRNLVTAATFSVGPGGSLGIFNFVPQAMSPGVDYSSGLVALNDFANNGNPPFDQFGLSASMSGRADDPTGRYWYLSLGQFDSTAQLLSPGYSLLDGLPLDGLLLGFRQLTLGYTDWDAAGNQIFAKYAGDQSFTISEVTAVPETATWALMGAGLIGLLLFRRRPAA
jgi:hypothetical protein